MKKVLITLSFITSIGIVLYWILVFIGLFPIIELVPGYKDWFFSFPLADFWIAISAFSAAFLLKKENELSIPLGITAGSSMVFLSLYAATYGFLTGLIWHQTIDEYIEIAIKLYCLIVGLFFIYSFWRLRRELVK